METMFARKSSAKYDGLIPTEMISQYINVIIIFSRFFVFKNYEKYPPPTPIFVLIGQWNCKRMTDSLQYPLNHYGAKNENNIFFYLKIDN